MFGKTRKDKVTAITNSLVHWVDNVNILVQSKDTGDWYPYIGIRSDSCALCKLIKDRCDQCPLSQHVGMHCDAKGSPWRKVHAAWVEKDHLATLGAAQNMVNVLADLLKATV